MLLQNVTKKDIAIVLAFRLMAIAVLNL